MGGNDHFPIRDRPMGVTNDKSAATPGPCFLAGSLGHQYDSGRASRVPVSLHAPEFLVHRWCSRTPDGFLGQPSICSPEGGCER